MHLNSRPTYAVSMDSESSPRVSPARKLAAALVTALAGGVYWCAVRPSGYGCGPSVGLAWGLFWVAMLWTLYPGTPCPAQGLYVLTVFVVGFALAGTQGYGQFNQWVLGRFYLETATETHVPLAPAWGFGHLFVCGLTWGGIPALALAWLLFGENRWQDWALRVGVGVAGYFAFQFLVEATPQVFLPLYGEGYYADLTQCPDCARTLESMPHTYSYLGAFLALSTLTLARHRESVRVLLPMALGFGATFAVGGVLHRGQLLPGWEGFPWWKTWEFACGFGGGLTVAGTFWWLHHSGDLDQFARASQGKWAAPRHYWWGFWIPLYTSAGILARDRLHQIAKVYYLACGIDFRDEFLVLEVAAAVAVGIAFVRKYANYARHGRPRADLHIQHPRVAFVGVYSLFFWISMGRWFDFPFTIADNVITLLALGGYALSLGLLPLVIPSPSQTRVRGRPRPSRAVYGPNLPDAPSNT